MIELIILNGNTIIEEYLVPDDYLLSTYLELMMNNDKIYLDEMENNNIESLILGQNIDLSDALIFADYYKMFYVT